MKSVLVILIIMLLPAPFFAQYEEVVPDTRPEKEIIKEQKKAERDSIRKRQGEIVDSMLLLHRFVLEADYISGKSGYRSPVSSNLNFIVVDSAEAVIQLGSTTGMGYNGVGGITVEGKVTKYDLVKKVKEKSTNYSLIIYVITAIGTYDITFWISQDGYTSATIRGNTSGQLSYSGRLVRIGESRIYKGSAI